MLRAIRFDRSDTHVFEVAAQPEEWLVSGASTFQTLGPDEMKGKLRQAFANGFLGTVSLGHATFAVVASASEDALAEAEAELAGNLAAKLGAPADVAEAIAAGEIAFARDLCKDLEPGAVLGVVRRRGEDGQISEEFHQIKLPSATLDPATGAELPHARIWTIVDDEN